jgi:hypothetical protein
MEIDSLSSGLIKLKNGGIHITDTHCVNQHIKNATIGHKNSSLQI